MAAVVREQASSHAQEEAGRCPPCSVPVTVACFGRHGTAALPCSSAAEFCCGAPCGRALPCGHPRLHAALPPHHGALLPSFHLLVCAVQKQHEIQHSAAPWAPLLSKQSCRYHRACSCLQGSGNQNLEK